MPDIHVEQFKNYTTFHFAYLKGLTEVMQHEVKPLREEWKVVGRAFTVKGPGLYVNALEEMPAGSVVVHGETAEDDGVWSAGLARLYGGPRGIAGVVVDGGVYQARALRQQDLPVFCRYVTPRPAANRLRGETQVPVVCGGVTVQPGDVIIGDGDGVVVVPQAKQDEVLEGLSILREGFAYFFNLLVPPPLSPSESPEIMEMFALKDADPVFGWRGYQEWAARLREKYGPPGEIWKRRPSVDEKGGDPCCEDL
jgi:regulator of RNase E activity RraA